MQSFAFANLLVAVPTVAVAILEPLSEVPLVQSPISQGRAVPPRRRSVVSLVPEVEPLTAPAVAAPLGDARVVACLERRLPELGRAAPVPVAPILPAPSLALCQDAHRRRRQE